MTDPTKPLCVFEVDGKPCARPETHGVHNETLMSDAKLYFRYHPYAPPAETGRQHCHAQTDGDCTWKDCPQLKDYKSYCPLAAADDKFYGEDI